MYCPNCKSEYRTGFTRCSDCDVDLVEAFFVDDETQWKSIWKGDSQADCVDSCKELREADIAYRVAQTPVGLGRGMGVDFKYEITVPTADYSRAMAVLSMGEAIPEESFEIPANDAPEFQRSSGPVAREKSLNSNLEVEVFSQAPKDHSSIVELSLSTNSIPFQTEIEDDGTRRFFVTPEDEPLAREIIRQIQEGTPPE